MERCFICGRRGGAHLYWCLRPMRVDRKIATQIRYEKDHTSVSQKNPPMPSSTKET